MEVYEEIIESLCESYGIRKEHLLSRRRDKELVKVKKLCYSMLRQEGLSYPQIGKLMHKNHTTVLKVLRGMK